jgi:hypothetical protein
MTRRLLALVLGLAFLAACQGDDGGQQASDTTGNVAPETTVAPTTTTRAPDAKVREGTQKYDDGTGGSANVTVFRYRDAGVLPAYAASEWKREGKRTVAIEVRTCVTGKPVDIEDEVTISWAPWSISDAGGGNYEAYSAHTDLLVVQPLYPQNDRPTPVGTCRRGWIAFDIGSTTRPTVIEYAPGIGNVLKWRIKR